VLFWSFSLLALFFLFFVAEGTVRLFFGPDPLDFTDHDMIDCGLLDRPGHLRISICSDPFLMGSPPNTTASGLPSRRSMFPFHSFVRKACPSARQPRRWPALWDVAGHDGRFLSGVKVVITRGSFWARWARLGPFAKARLTRIHVPKPGLALVMPDESRSIFGVDRPRRIRKSRCKGRRPRR